MIEGKLLPAHQSSPRSNDVERSPFNIALIGAGRIGSVHARNIVDHPESALRYVVDLDGARAEELARSTGARAVPETKALGDAEIDAVVVASSTSSHPELIERSMAAGKAVFCEKPIDVSIERVRSCLATIEGRTEPLLVAFNRRFDPAVVELRRRIDRGAIGDVELVTIISKDPIPPPLDYVRSSGGLFRDMTLHDFDMARFLLGEEPSRVTASAAALTDAGLAEADDHDTASVTLQCPSGRLAVITNSRRSSAGYDQRLEVHGSQGMLRTENVARTSLVQESDDGVLRSAPLHFFIERYHESYRNEWNHFVRVLHGVETPSPTGIDGYRALALAEAAYCSLETGRVVDVSSVER